MASDTRAKVLARKDARNTKSSDASRAVPSAKDTKRWCGGKVGRDHKPKCFKRVYSPKGIDWGWRELRCETCGKILNYYNPDFSEPKPSWVTE